LFCGLYFIQIQQLENVNVLCFIYIMDLVPKLSITNWISIGFEKHKGRTITGMYAVIVMVVEVYNCRRSCHRRREKTRKRVRPWYSGHNFVGPQFTQSTNIIDIIDFFSFNDPGAVVPEAFLPTNRRHS
jgi:hypothetical protein